MVVALCSAAKRTASAAKPADELGPAEAGGAFPAAAEWRGERARAMAPREVEAEEDMSVGEASVCRRLGRRREHASEASG